MSSNMETETYLRVSLYLSLLSLTYMTSFTLFFSVKKEILVHPQIVLRHCIIQLHESLELFITCNIVGRDYVHIFKAKLFPSRLLKTTQQNEQLWGKTQCIRFCQTEIIEICFPLLSFLFSHSNLLYKKTSFILRAVDDTVVNNGQNIQIQLS